VPLTRITVGQKESSGDIVEINNGGVEDDHRAEAAEPVPLTRLVSDRSAPADPLLAEELEPVPLTKLSTSQQLTAMPIPGSIGDTPNPFAYDEDVEQLHEGAAHQVVDPMGRMVPAEPSLPPPAPVVDPTTVVTSPWERQMAGYLDQLSSESESDRMAAIDALTKAGPSTLDTICERFPGPLQVDPFSPDATNLPPFAKCGPLLSVLERYGWDAHEEVVRRLDAPDPLVRFFAIYFYAAVFVPEAIPRLIQRLHDEESRICMLAARTLFSYREHPDFAHVLEHLHGRLAATSVTARRHAAYLIGLFRDVTAIPALIAVLDHKDKGMVDVAEDALAEIAKQRFNGSARKWRAWWAKNEARSRIEWLIDGLGAKDVVLRRSAAEELRAVTGLDMGFDEDGPKRDREDARQRWLSWWEESRTS
jgi:HEAT repeat protein